MSTFKKKIIQVCSGFEFSHVNIVFTLEGRVVQLSIERFPTPKIWAMAYRFPERYIRSCTFRYLLIFRDCFYRTPSMKLDNQPRFAYVGKIHSLKKMRATPLLWWFMENEARPEFTISRLCQNNTTFENHIRGLWKF